MNYVASDAADGAIGYDEFSYALGKNFPVAKIENANGYYTLPSQYNVAVALTAAQINKDKSSPNYLLQNLDNVYNQKDNRTYPLSSYSYMVIPTASDDQRMTTAKRQTLADYLFYSICEGQKEMGPIGYSPLPINLAQASFDQVGKLKEADSAVDLDKRDIKNCGNPTFVAGQPSRNYLAEIAPQPQPCDRDGAGPCSTTTNLNSNPTKSGTIPTTTTTGGTTAGGRAAAPSAAGVGGVGLSRGPAIGAVTGTPGTATSPVTLDPETGAVVASAGGSATDVTGVPTELASGTTPVSNAVLGPLAVLLLLAAVVAPPLLARRLQGQQ